MEEHTIAFASNLGKNSGRGVRRVGDKFEARLSCRPVNGSRVLNVIAGEPVRLVTDLHSILDAAPTDVEGGIGGDRGAAQQSVHNIMVVLNLQVTEVHRSFCLIEVNFDAVIGDAYRPEQAARGDTRVEVVDLIRRGQRPLIEVQSDEAEGGSMLFSVHSNVDSLHETGVCVEEERSGVTSTGICSCASPLNFCNTDKAVKIGDGRRLGAMSGQEDVEHLCPWTEGLEAARNGSRSDLSASAGMRNCGYPESCAESGAGGDGRCSDELATREHSPFPKVGVTYGMMVAVRLAFYWRVSLWNDQWFLLSRR
jgi:hypothetical protein